MPKSRVQVEERRRAVKVTVRSREYPMDPGVEFCPHQQTLRIRRVRLVYPLGSRVLLDGARARGDRQVWPR
jgi:hypothetical protein